MTAAAEAEAIACELRAAEYRSDIDAEGAWQAAKREPRRPLSDQMGLIGTYQEVGEVAHALNAEQHRSGGFDWLYFPEPLAAAAVKHEVSLLTLGGDIQP